MQPLTPLVRQRVLEQAKPEEVAEYERLLAERFMTDPSVPKDPATAEADEKRNARLGKLQAKLFASSSALSDRGD